MTQLLSDEPVQVCPDCDIADCHHIRSTRQRQLDDTQMYAIDSNWEKATPEQKLAWYNGMAKRPVPISHHWREILELNNYFARQRPAVDWEGLRQKAYKAQTTIYGDECQNRIFRSGVDAAISLLRKELGNGSD